MKKMIWLALTFGLVPCLLIEYFLRKKEKLEKPSRTIKKE